MHVEVGTIIVATIIWLLSIAHMYFRGHRRGWLQGNHIGISTTISTFEKLGIIDDSTYDSINKAVVNTFKDVKK